MQIAVLLYHLGNDDKEKSLNTFSTDVTFFLNIFHPWLVEFMNADL
jgi:hypothetical protein